MRIPVMERKIDGADVTGGDLTPEKDAGEMMEEVNADRIEEQEMQEDQMEGEVEEQTHETEPKNSARQSEKAMKTPPTNAKDEPDYELQIKHLAADFENFKRQATRRESETRDRAVQTTLMQILPVLDNFHLALKHADTAKNVADLKIGLQFIAQQLETALRDLGVEPIKSEGENFDPLKHEAIEQIEADANPGTIVEEAQRGYVYKGNVLRTSRVKVAQ